MFRTLAFALLLSAPLVSTTALAAPPANSKPLSEIVKMLEDTGNVAYFEEIEWDDDGYWEIEYKDKQGREIEIKVDPISGQVRR
jgi:hypothetical protein